MKENKNLFKELTTKLMEKLDLSVVSEDVLRTLGFFTKKYNNAAALLIKPKFMITENVISVILPVISEKYNVTADEEKVVRTLENGAMLSSSEIAKVSGFNKVKTLRVLDSLKEKSYVKINGNGRGTKYSL